MILAATIIIAIVGVLALCLPLTWRVLADLFLIAARVSGALALTLEAAPDTFRQMHAQARKLTGEER